ncbi:MAG: hypothetical protein AB7I25_01295 [Vicinamibacterales bacterium]
MKASLSVRVAGLVLIAAPIMAWLSTATPAKTIHVRWRDGIAPSSREQSERRFLLVNPAHLKDDTWAYDLLDSSRRNVRAIVESADVADTHEIDRAGFRLGEHAPRGRATSWVVHRIPILRLPWVGVVLFYALPAIGAGLTFTRRRRVDEAAPAPSPRSPAP